MFKKIDVQVSSMSNSANLVIGPTMFDVSDRFNPCQKTVYEFDNQWMNMFESIQCSKNGVRVLLMFYKMVFQPLTTIFLVWITVADFVAMTSIKNASETNWFEISWRTTNIWKKEKCIKFMALEPDIHFSGMLPFDEKVSTWFR